MSLALAAPAAATLGIGLFNLLTWPRAGGPVSAEPASVLIPARDEAANIADAVEAALAAGAAEVIVCDDNSTDGTGQIVEALARRDLRVRLILAPPLPAGWVGKAHACHQLASAARHPRLVFVDADVRLAPGAIPRLIGLASAWHAGVVSAFPRQLTESSAERLLMPLLALTYVAWLPLLLIPLTSDPRFLAANGQVLAIDRDALDRIGGFAAIRGALVDDMALCRRAKTLGIRVLFADGQDLAACRMYEDHASLWAGFEKNLYEGLGSPAAWIAAMVANAAAFVLPWLLLAVSPWEPAFAAPGAVGVGANLLLRAALAARYGHRPASVLAHPLAVIWLLTLAVASWRAARRGTQRWRGRAYAPPTARSAS